MCSVFVFGAVSEMRVLSSRNCKNIIQTMPESQKVNTEINAEKGKEKFTKTVSYTTDSETLSLTTVIEGMKNVNIVERQKNADVEPVLVHDNPESQNMKIKIKGTTISPKEENTIATEYVSSNKGKLLVVNSEYDYSWQDEPGNLEETQLTEEEKNDNDDTLWEPLKNLGSNYDRFKAVVERWRNLAIPNPKKDLTCRCQKVKTYNNDNTTILLENQTNKCPWGTGYCSTNREGCKSESCTILFEREIDKVKKEIRLLRNQLRKIRQGDIMQLATHQAFELHCACRERWPEEYFRLLWVKHQQERMELIQNFDEAARIVTYNAEQKIESARQAISETRTLYEFYPAGENSLSLTPEETQEIMEIDSMLTHDYKSIYGAPAKNLL